MPSQNLNGFVIHSRFGRGLLSTDNNDGRPASIRTKSRIPGQARAAPLTVMALSL